MSVDSFLKAQLNDIDEYEIDLDYVMGLWESQEGKCALSELPMKYEFDDLCSVSIDRVDSSLGYVPGNVQLVCQWVNRAKNTSSDSDFRSLLASLPVRVPVSVITDSVVLGMADGFAVAVRDHEFLPWWDGVWGWEIRYGSHYVDFMLRESNGYGFGENDSRCVLVRSIVTGKHKIKM